MPMEYIVPSLCITTFTNMEKPDIMEEFLVQILALEEDRFIANFHQQVQKACNKAWHDRYIHQKTFVEGDLVLLYDSQFVKHPRKFRQHWLGPYTVKEIMDGGAVRLATLRSDVLPRYVNGSRLKPYRDKLIYGQNSCLRQNRPTRDWALRHEQDMHAGEDNKSSSGTISRPAVIVTWDESQEYVGGLLEQGLLQAVKLVQFCIFLSIINLVQGFQGGSKPRKHCNRSKENYMNIIRVYYFYCYNLCTITVVLEIYQFGMGYFYNSSYLISPKHIFFFIFM